MTRKPPADHPQMLLHSSTTGTEFLRSLDPPLEGEAQIEVVQRNIHLQNVLRLFPQINELEGFAKHLKGGGRPELQDRYPDQLDRIIANSEDKRYRLNLTAKKEFAGAFGLDEMVVSGIWSASKASAVARGAYGEFTQKFKHPSLEKARNAELIKLIKQEIIYTNHFPIELEKDEKIDPKVYDKLNTHNKLLALKNDPRAEFLPASNKERTMALVFLDYFEQADRYPDGAMHQLDEIFIRRARGFSRQDIGADGRPTRKDSTYGTDEAIKTMRSLGFEMGDYYLNAVTQINVLRQLRSELAGLNPHISLGEALGPEHAGIPTILRFMDQSYYLATGENPKGVYMRDIFRSHRNEAAAADIPGKNKVVEDPYTGQEPTKAAQKRIAKGAKTVTVAEAWRLLEPAEDNEMYRAKFWEARLRDSQKRRFVWTGGRVALELVGSQ